MAENVVTGDNLDDLDVDVSQDGDQDQEIKKDEYTKESLNELTKAKLVEFAEERDIEVDKTKKKDIIIDAILSSLGVETTESTEKAVSEPSKKRKLMGISASDGPVYK